MHLYQLLFTQTWAWWAGGLGLGFTALGFAWFTGLKLGISSIVEALLTPSSAKTKKAPSSSSILFLLGLPLGGLLANWGHWNWTWTYGRMDALSLGSLVLKVVLLFIGGLFVGFGARWAGGCTSGFSLMGISRGNWMAILATLGFLVSGIITTQILYKVF